MDTGRVDDRKLTSLSPPNGGLSVNDASEDGVGRRQAPVLTHLLLLSSIFVPLVLLPYIPIRRHLLSLHRKLDDLAATTSSLRSELKVSQLEVALRRQEHLRLRDRLITTKREIESLTLETARHSKDRAAVDDEFRKSIRELLNERDQTRAQLGALKDLGPSLADVAAFMHEMDLQQGYVTRSEDFRGIDRLRLLALRLQQVQNINTMKSADVDSDSKGQTSTKDTST